jgi:DNA-directed RNA polymerase specialized sigma24 family protein
MEQDRFALTQSYLTKHGEGATSEESNAWQEFYATYDPVILESLRCAHRDAQTIEDQAQDEWIILLRWLPKWGLDPASPGVEARVRLIARRLAIGRRRWKFKRQAGALTTEHAEAVSDLEAGPGAALDRFERLEKFRSVAVEVAARLREPARRIVIGFWVEGCTIASIALELGMKEKSVRQVLARRRSNLIQPLRRASFDFE